MRAAANRRTCVPSSEGEYLAHQHVPLSFGLVHLTIAAPEHAREAAQTLFERFAPALKFAQSA
jgi:hypothetical protein